MNTRSSIDTNDHSNHDIGLIKLEQLENKIKHFQSLAAHDKENINQIISPRQFDSDALPTEVEDHIKSKDDEIKVLWNVIKEINKGKVDESEVAKKQQQFNNNVAFSLGFWVFAKKISGF